MARSPSHRPPSARPPSPPHAASGAGGASPRHALLIRRAGSRSVGYLIPDVDHPEVYAELKVRLADLLEVLHARKLEDLAQGIPEPIAGLVDPGVLARLVADLIEERTGRPAAPIGRESIRKYVRLILEAVEAASAQQGVPFDRKSLIRTGKRSKGIGLAVDLEILDDPRSGRPPGTGSVPGASAGPFRPQAGRRPDGNVPRNVPRRGHVGRGDPT